MCKFFLLLVICLISTCTALPQQQRIAGGVDARLGEDPYIAAILFAEDNVNFRVICGGAIINNRSVLSATSCWMYTQVKQLRVRVGSIYANSGGSVRNVDFVIFHPGYDSWNRDNNICLLRVTSIIPFGNNVQPIGITSPDFDLNINTPVLTMGWGQTSVNGPSYSNKLRRVEIRTFSHVNCRSIYGVNFITNNHICAGWSYTPARGACAGDIGSPLVYGNIVVGVTSMITGCGNRNFPATYMWIPRYSNWIENNA